MPILTFFSVALVLSLFQAEPGDETLRITKLVEQLGDQDPERRVQAERDLTQLKTSAVTLLRRIQAKAEDPEVKARLGKAIREITLRDAEGLYAQGKLTESLLRRAEAEGATDPSAYVAQRTRQAKEEIKKILPAEGKGIGHASYHDVIKKVQAEGPWALPVIIAMLGDAEFAPQAHATNILLGLSDPR